MAKTKTMASGEAVVLAVSPDDREFLCRLFTMALGGIHDELDEYPGGLRAPVHLLREEGIYERLLAGLDGERLVPDGEMRQLLRELTELNDRENEYARVVAEHAALLGLREQLDPQGR